MDDLDRGKIRNRECAGQLKDFSGLRFGKITPTDIDGFVAPMHYNEYLASKNKNIIKKLQDYNKDDLTAPIYILKKINKMRAGKYYDIEELRRL